MKKLNLFNLKKTICLVWQRFPVSLVLCLLVSFFFSFSIGFGDILNKQEEQIILKLAITLILTFFLSIGIYIFTESLKFNTKKSNTYQILSILFGVFFYNYLKLDFFNNTDSVIFIILSLSLIISFLFVAYFLKNIGKPNFDEKKYFNYFYNIAFSFFLSFIFAIILYILGMIAISSIIYLFDLKLNLNSELYLYWTTFSLTLVLPIFLLTKIPPIKNILDEKEINKFFEFLMKYVLLSFIGIYFLILYAYSIKVLLNFSDWPKGQVSWMVILFSIFAYLFYAFSFTMQEKVGIIKNARKYLPYIILPQTFMLFYAIYLRISQYDLTTNRYFVVVFGICLVTISLYFILSKRKSLASIPLFLSFFSIIISVGPRSVYSLPETRQIERLEKNLIKAGILNESGDTKKITSLEDYNDIESKLGIDITSGIRYLCNFNNCSSIKEIFPLKYEEIEKDDKKEFEINKKKNLENLEKNFKKSIEKNNSIDKKNYEKRKREIENRIYKGPSRWSITKSVIDHLNINKPYHNPSYDNREESENLYFSLGNIPLYPIDIKPSHEKILKIYGTIHNENIEYIVVNPSNEEIIYKNGEETIDEFDFNILKKKLLNINSKDKENKLVLELSGEKYDIVLYFKSIYVKNPKYKGNTNYDQYYYIDGIALLKKR